MASPQEHHQVIARLRAHGVDRLIELYLDEILERPMQEVLDPTRLARSLAGAIRSAAARPDLADRVQVMLRDLQERSTREAREQDSLRKLLPPELHRSFRPLLSEPWVPDRRLVEALMDHEAMSSLVTDVLQAVLISFGKKIRSIAPDAGRVSQLGSGLRAPGLSSLRAIGSSVAAVGSGVAHAFGAEIERQIEQRAREHVDGAIQSVLSDVVSHLTDPRRARSMAAWRAHCLGVVMDTPMTTWGAELRKLKPETLGPAILASLRALAASEDLAERLEGVIRSAFDNSTKRSLGQHLRDLGLEEEWRRETALLIRSSMNPLLASDAFATWVEEMLTGTKPSDPSDADEPDHS